MRTPEFAEQLYTFHAVMTLEFDGHPMIFLAVMTPDFVEQL